MIYMDLENAHKTYAIKSYDLSEFIQNQIIQQISLKLQMF